jgi:hypothetical protein
MFSNVTQCLTELSPAIINKGRKTLYLILKGKPLPEQIMDDLREQVEKRYLDFINSKRKLLETIKPEDPEEFYECFLLKAMITVLEEMLKEKKINLTEKDRQTLKDVFKDESKNKKIKKNQTPYEKISLNKI